MNWLLLAIGLALLAALIAAAAAVMLIMGRRAEARALVTFLPDCAVLCRRLARDPRVPRRHKLLLLAFLAYLAMPFDLVLDVIPVVGQLDDVILFVLVLRMLLRAAGAEAVRELWPGPDESLAVVLRLAGRTPTAEPAGPCDPTTLSTPTSPGRPDSDADRPGQGSVTTRSVDRCAEAGLG
jgi:uncharacterized membrane protein YkvA (DUF1232 family)